MLLGSCLITTMIWSDGHWSPRRVTALGSWTNHVIALRQISVTALFYLEDSRRIHPRRREESGGARQRVGKGGRERERAFAQGGERESGCTWLLLLWVFSPRACPMQIGLSQECCSPRSPHSGPRSSFDLPLFYFRGLFPCLSFSLRHFGLLFPILTTEHSLF